MWFGLQIVTITKKTIDMADPDILFSAAGGASSIGGSAYLVKVGLSTVLIDCGMHPEQPPVDAFKQLTNSILGTGFVPALESLSAVVLTHAHTDHSGLLPGLYREMRQALGTCRLPPYYASEGTRNLLPITYENMLLFSPEVPYDEGDVAGLLQKHLRPPEKDGSLDWLNPLAGKLNFYPTSHLLGAVMVELEIEGRRVLYSGDLQIGATPTLPQGLYPDRQPDLLIIDGTHAGASSAHAQPAWEHGKIELGKILDEILPANGVVLLPCFALGRSQDILALVLAYAKDCNNQEFYVYIDGQSRRVTRDIYPRFRTLLNPEYLELIDSNKWRIRWVDPKLDFEQLLELEVKGYPAVVIASSGMLLPGSASRRWAEVLVDDPQNALVFTGYLVEDVREEVFDHLVVSDKTWKRRPAQLSISGHASLQDTLTFIEQINPRNVIIVHCGARNKEDLYAPGSLLAELNLRSIPATVAEQGQIYRIAASGGILNES